ncbi:nicotinamide riboside transporter PnuC [uncultured Dokdonia sp.]|uniref:nicotinamide riboside transporter PnuC n=1 Tax=uncultured Dokdonia sp. TaxID=575653 RepID=UPI002605AA2E|nr:nicotinamide riboside transporter PnuC [uncultured Dokdonia sp.]
MSQIFDFFLAPYQEATTLNIILEIIAVIFGVVGVWFGKRENILVYPLGIISTVIFVYLCNFFELYGEVIINIYYTLMSIYGWYTWLQIKNGTPLAISRMSKKDTGKALIIFISTALFVVAIYLYENKFDKWTDYIDTVTTGLCFAAMWLMANKKLEHWSLWIIANIISIPLYFVKGLGFTGIQFIILLIIAIQGHIAWKKHLDNSPATA